MTASLKTVDGYRLIEIEEILDVALGKVLPNLAD